MPTLPKLTTLLLSSNHLLRDQISEFITRAGYAVLEADKIPEAEALAIGCRRPIAVFVTDVSPSDTARFLSLMSGRQRWMRALVITAHCPAVMEEVMPDARLAFIEKPFAWSELKFRIAERVRASQTGYCREVLWWSARVRAECETAFQRWGYVKPAA